MLYFIGQIVWIWGENIQKIHNSAFYQKKKLEIENQFDGNLINDL